MMFTIYENMFYDSMETKEIHLEITHEKQLLKKEFQVIVRLKNISITSITRLSK